jgi:hypothetical protein
MYSSSSEEEEDFPNIASKGGEKEDRTDDKNDTVNSKSNSQANNNNKHQNDTAARLLNKRNHGNGNSEGGGRCAGVKRPRVEVYQMYPNCIQIPRRVGTKENYVLNEYKKYARTKVDLVKTKYAQLKSNLEGEDEDEEYEKNEKNRIFPHTDKFSAQGWQLDDLLSNRDSDYLPGEYGIDFWEEGQKHAGDERITKLMPIQIISDYIGVTNCKGCHSSVDKTNGDDHLNLPNYVETRLWHMPYIPPSKSQLEFLLKCTGIKLEQSEISFQNDAHYCTQHHLPLEKNSRGNGNEKNSTMLKTHGNDKNSTMLNTSHRWTKAEHDAFQKGVQIYGRNWRKIAQQIPTRKPEVIRQHVSQYFAKVATNRHQHASVSLSNNEKDKFVMFGSDSSACNSSSSDSDDSDDSLFNPFKDFHLEQNIRKWKKQEYDGYRQDMNQAIFKSLMERRKLIDVYDLFDVTALVTLGMLVEECMTAGLLPLAQMHVKRCRSLEISKHDAIEKSHGENGEQSSSDKNIQENDQLHNPFIQWTVPADEAILNHCQHSTLYRRRQSTNDSFLSSGPFSSSIKKSQTTNNKSVTKKSDILSWCKIHGFEIEFVLENMDLFQCFVSKDAQNTLLAKENNYESKLKKEIVDVKIALARAYSSGGNNFSTFSSALPIPPIIDRASANEDSELSE